jgi:competence protein ComEC
MHRGDTPASGRKASLARHLDAWVEAERGRSVLFLPVLMAGGSVFYFSLPAEPGLLAPAMIAGICLCATALPQPPAARAILLGAGVCAAGFLSACLATRRAAPWEIVPRHAVLVTGRVALLDMLPQGRRVTLQNVSLDGRNVLARRVRLRLRDDDPLPIVPGDTLQLRALLQPPPPPAYPGGWDLQRDSFFGGMAAYGFATGTALRIQAWPQPRLQTLRADVAARIMAALPGPRGAIAATLLTGLGTAIPAPDRRNFQDSGLAHLLAVAGLHIGIVMGLVFGLIRFLLAALEAPALYWPAKRIAAVAALAAGGAYLALTGAHIPIQRSFAMASLVTLAVLTGRRASPLRALALAALLLLAAAPDAVMGVSFQMSFAAVLALLAGYEALRPFRLHAAGRASWKQRIVLFPLLLAVTSALAGTASLPFAAYHFGRAALFYVPANMAAVPLMAFWVMPCCVAALLLMPLGWEHLALAPAGLGISGLMAIARTVSAWPDAAPSLPQMPGWGLALTSAGLAWLGIWRSPWRLAAILPIGLACASPWLAEQPAILVTPEATVIAVRSGAENFMAAGKRADPFALEAPARVWGHPPKNLPCQQAACDIAVGGLRMILARNGAGLRCDTAQIVVSATRLGAGCAAGFLIDSETTRLTGAVALYTHAGTIREITDRAWRGDRPWVFTGRPVLPPAQTE